MNAWALRRKRIILAIVLGFIFIVAGVPIYFALHKPPTCFDNRMNGDEEGVDCGGSCMLLCSNKVLPLILKGDPRVLRLSDDTYEVVGVTENPNVSGQVFRGTYTFTLYGKNDATPIKTISGSTFIPRGQTFAVFQGPFIVTEAVPVRATLVWSEDEFIWDKNTDNLPSILIKEGKLSGLDNEPRLQAVVSNASLDPVSNLELVALVSDASGNTIAASKTFIDVLRPGESTPILFGWPTKFTLQAATYEILYRFLPDKTFIK